MKFSTVLSTRARCFIHNPLSLKRSQILLILEIALESFPSMFLL